MTLSEQVLLFLKLLLDSHVLENNKHRFVCAHYKHIRPRPSTSSSVELFYSTEVQHYCRRLACLWASFTGVTMPYVEGRKTNVPECSERGISLALPKRLSKDLAEQCGYKHYVPLCQHVQQQCTGWVWLADLTHFADFSFFMKYTGKSLCVWGTTIFKLSCWIKGCVDMF